MKLQWACYNVFCLLIVAITVIADWGRQTRGQVMLRALCMAAIWVGGNLLLVLLAWRDAVLARHLENYQPRRWPPKIKII